MSSTKDANTQPPVGQRIREAMPRLTPAERKVAHILLASYPMAGLDTVAAFAARAQTSGPTILRFIAKIGFDSYNAFQRSLRTELADTLDSPLSRYDHAPPGTATGSDDPLGRLSDALTRNVAEGIANISRGEFAEVMGLLCDENRAVYCLGGRFSRTIAAYLHQYLRQLRRNTHLVDGPNDIWTECLLDMGRRDVLVVFDFRRYQSDVGAFAEKAARRGARLVLVTDVWHSPIAAHARHVIACPVTVPTAWENVVAPAWPTWRIFATERQGAAHRPPRHERRPRANPHREPRNGDPYDPRPHYDVLLRRFFRPRAG
jgi:DNA-binding MurR/RpiR family transcriptional regulator